MELDVLICTHGARGWVQRCVESLMRSERRGEFRVLVHDDKASERDGTREYLKSIADCGLNGERQRRISNSQHSISNNQGNGNEWRAG